jgi:uncharacterized surface protein with fasciclin (FAS1) repeats
MGIVHPGPQSAVPLPLDHFAAMYGGVHSGEMSRFTARDSEMPRGSTVIQRRCKTSYLLNLNFFAQCRTRARIGAHWLVQLHSQLNRPTYFRSLTSRSSFMNQDTNVNEKPSKNIAEMASEIASFSALAAGLKEVGLVDTLAGTGPFTVFAPSDEAFKKLPHGALDALMKDKVKLKAVLSHHVVLGRMLAKDLKAGDLKAVDGSMLHVKVSGASVEISGARILGADVLAANGVIHIIDVVLSPKNVKLLAEAA